MTLTRQQYMAALSRCTTFQLLNQEPPEWARTFWKLVEYRQSEEWKMSLMGFFRLVVVMVAFSCAARFIPHAWCQPVLDDIGWGFTLGLAAYATHRIIEIAIADAKRREKEEQS